MADVKWIKLATDIFDNRKIRQIECLPDGDAVIVVWVKLLCLAGNINDSGYVYFTKEIPYTDQMLAAQFNRPLATVQLALRTFEQFGMVEVIDDILHISNWEKYQSVDRLSEIREYNRLAKQKSRAKQKLLADVNDESMTSQRCHDTEEEKEKEREKEYHSIILAEKSDEEDGLSTDLSTDVDNQRVALGGSLGKGVVMLSPEQTDDLLDKLSLDEFNHYVGVVADCILKGKRYKKKTHYQAILDMARADRRLK